MSHPQECPKCGSEIPPDAPQGVCPRCALQAGFRSGSETFTGPGSAGREPLSPEELSRRLPGLEVLERLGSGGMGTVYLARQTELDRRVALKVLHPDLREGASFAERFSREARTLARLAHPNIVSVYDFGQAGNAYYLVMELVEGVNLRQAIEAGTMEPKQALAIIPSICDALQFAHDHGVVHRDIKPENVLLDKQGRVKIADFGLAKLVGAAAGDQRLTAAEQVMGTPHYMAPEQIERPAAVDHRADIYALGVVLYELLTGELPMGRFPPPSHKVQVDVRLDDVVLRTLEKEPDLRYQRASDLRTDVESLSRPGAAVSPARRDGANGYEYRSARTLWGWPLLHVAFSGGRAGTKIARGVVAIGDVAIGGCAVGGVAIGGLTLGGVSAGLLSMGGVVLGLVAMGGVVGGAFALGGISSGIVAVGERANSLLTLAPEVLERLTTTTWALTNVAIGAGFVMALVALQGGRASPARRK